MDPPCSTGLPTNDDVSIWTAVMRFNNWQGNVILLGHGPWSGIALVAALCATSWWLDKYVDIPVRRRLSRALPHRSTRAADSAVEKSRG